MQEGGEEPMTVDGGAADARKRNYSDACDGASEDDDRALEDMALAFGAGQGGDDEMSSSSSSSSDDEDFEYDGDGLGHGGSRTPPRGRGVRGAPTQPRKTHPELMIPSIEQLLREKQAADVVKQRRREAVEREEAEYAAQLAETERICGNIMSSVTQMDDLLPRQFLRDAGTFVEPGGGE